MERAYCTRDDALRTELIEQFAKRVAEYKATVHRVHVDALPAAIAQACAARGVRQIVVPADLPDEWLPHGIDVLRDDGLSHAQLDESDGVVTGCALGIVQTGTIVLDGGPHQGRRAITLLPDDHLCVVRADQVVGIVPEAIAALAAAARALGIAPERVAPFQFTASTKGFEVKLAAHRAAVAAIKAVRSDLPVGWTLANADVQSAPGGEERAMRSTRCTS